jgi:putative intracellular protease/amidase
MCAPVNRRSFVASMAALIPAYALISPSRAFVARPRRAKSVLSTAQSAQTYVCPPCGLPCDKLSFDKPGSCPQCGMTLIPAGGEGIPTVAMLLYDGVEIIDISGPWEAFGTAGFLVHTVAERSDPLTLVFNQKVLPDFTFENSPKADILLVPGGGYTQAIENPRLIQWVQAKSRDVSHVMSVCTGAFILGKAGLLAGQTATATHGMIDDLLAFPNVKVVHDQRFVDNGKIMTTGGLSSGIDGALHLISRMRGLGAAQSAALAMEYHWDPDSPFVRASLADKYLPDGLAFGKPNLAGAKATLISTEGATDRWEAKILVSEPHTQAEVIDLLRSRIAANAGRNIQSMRTSKLSDSSSRLNFCTPCTDPSKLTWTFTDENGRGWHGSGIVRSSGESGPFAVTLTLGRDAYRVAFSIQE